MMDQAIRSHAVTSFIIPPHAKIMLDVRLGRLTSLERYLADHPHGINTKVKTATNVTESFLELAVRFSQPNVAIWLLGKGAAETPLTAPHLLHHAVINGMQNLAQQFTTLGWDPWAPTVFEAEQKACPIHQAVSLSNVPMLEMWSSIGINIGHIDPLTGNNLLHVLCHTSSHQAGMDRPKNTAVWLMQHGVSWDHRNATNAPPGHLCLYPDFEKELQSIWSSQQASQTQGALSAALSSSAEKKPSPGKKM